MNKILYFNEIEEFYGGENWKLQVNIIDIWNKYQKKELTLEQFNKAYAERLTQYKNSILELGNDVWINIEQIIPKLSNTIDINESSNIYDDIYDWGDKNDIQIQTS